MEKIAHMRCYSCDTLGHLASGCPNKLERKAQANKEKQGNEKHNMSKEEKAQVKRKCYSCWERGHMAHSCPLGDISKPISIVDNNVLRKDGNGTSMVAIAKYPATHTKALPKYVASHGLVSHCLLEPSSQACLSNPKLGGPIHHNYGT